MADYSAVAVVDLGPALARMKLALSCYSEEVKARATYNALNFVGDKLRTQVRRSLTSQTHVSYQRAMRAIEAKRAHPQNLSYTIIAHDTAIPLIEFAKGVRPGQKAPIKTRAWENNASLGKNVFVVSFGGQMQLVKRISPHATKGRGKLGVRKLWGPIIPHEMLRENKETFEMISVVVPEQLEPRLLHELDQAVLRAKARSGT